MAKKVGWLFVGEGNNLPSSVYAPSLSLFTLPANKRQGQRYFLKILFESVTDKLFTVSATDNGNKSAMNLGRRR